MIVRLSYHYAQFFKMKLSMRYHSRIMKKISYLKKLALVALIPCFITTATASDKKLTLGVLPAADSIVLDTAISEGLFKAHKLDVTTLPFKSALEIGAAMRAGKIDGHFGDLMNVFMQNESGAPQIVVLTTTHTSKEQRCFGLVTAPKFAATYTTLSDLKDVRTAMSGGTIIDYLLDNMQETQGLDDHALIKTEVKQIPIRLQMLLAGQIETALLPEPLVSLVEGKGGRVLWDDTKLNETLAIVALKKDLLSTDEIRAFRQSVAEAAALIEKDPEKYRALMVKKRLIPKDGINSYKMLRFSLFDSADGLPPLPTDEELERVGKWMLSHKMLKAMPDIKSIVFRDL